MDGNGFEISLALFFFVEESGYRMLWAEEMQDGARKATRIAHINKLADEMGIRVDYELGL